MVDSPVSPLPLFHNIYESSSSFFLFSSLGAKFAGENREKPVSVVPTSSSSRGVEEVEEEGFELFSIYLGWRAQPSNTYVVGQKKILIENLRAI